MVIHEHPTVVIVDDIDYNRIIIKRMINAKIKEVKIIEAQNGKECVTMV
jgi:response regulator RpfG family c-di-GMP phosphodiesterase